MDNAQYISSDEEPAFVHPQPPELFSQYFIADELMHDQEEASHADDELTGSPPSLTGSAETIDDDLVINPFSHSSYEGSVSESIHSHSDNSVVAQLPTMPLRPEELVSELVDGAQVDIMVPALANFYSVNKMAFLQVFDRQIQLILRRSQLWEDREVSIYDKALLRLTQNGTDLDHPSAIQFYCEQFLGLNVNGDHQYGFETLNQAVRLQSILKPGKFRSTQFVLGHVSDEQYLELSSEAALSSGGATATEHIPSIPAGGGTRSDREPNLEPLWEVYEKAKNEFDGEFNREDRDDHEAFVAAKFLRDTAENLLTQLRDQTVSQIVLEELNGTYTMAKAMVVSLSGGRKRKFDPVASGDSIPRGPSDPGAGASSGASYSRTENMRAYDHRGRTRTQPQRAPQPPAFRRDEDRDDERYSFEERRSSFDERRARDDRNNMGHDQGHASHANPTAGAAAPEWFGRFNLADLQPRNRGHWARYDGLGMDEVNANRDGHEQGSGRGHGQHYPDRTARGSAAGTNTLGPRNARRDVDSYHPEPRS